MAMDRRSFISAASITVAAAAATETVAKPYVPGTKPNPEPGERLDARSFDPSVSDGVSAYVANTRFEQIDAETLTRTKHRVLDLIGCAIGGAPAPGNAALVRQVARTGGIAEASVIGYPVRAPASQVAMVNAVISRSYDFEVMSVNLGNGQMVASHHSPTTCMTALALAERDKATGSAFLSNLIVGDDVAARMVGAAGMDFAQGWDEASVFSGMGATAIAARSLALDPLRTREAFGICVDQLAGTVQAAWDAAMNWKLQQGRVCRDAIFSAELARDGWSGMVDPLLAPYGFFSQYTGGVKRPELLTTGLGKTYYGEDYYKPYPACSAAHVTIECALSLKENHQIDPAQVESILIIVPERTLDLFISKPYEPRRDAHCDANFSNPFMVANVLMHGSVRQEHYDEANLRSPMLLNLTARTRSVPLPVDAKGVTSRIEVTMKDGRVLRADHVGPQNRWPPRRRTTYAEIVAKFRQQVAFSRYVKPADADEIIRRIEVLEKEKDMSEFVRLVNRSYLQKV